MSLDSYLIEKNVRAIEGYSQQLPNQVADLINLSKNSVHSMEIGFNAGHSADLILKNNPNVLLTSFDMGEHASVQHAKWYIDKTYPGRHTLILGDSTKTVPKFIAENPGKVFDFIFIDGGHIHPVPTIDMDNCSKLADSNTVVALDDVVFDRSISRHWNAGPNTAWEFFLGSGKLVEKVRHIYEPGRGMCWGTYVK
jgi:predicted O-methyltransferase YrrM